MEWREPLLLRWNGRHIVNERSVGPNGEVQLAGTVQYGHLDRTTSSSAFICNGGMEWQNT